MLKSPDTHGIDKKDYLKQTIMPLVVAVTGNPNIEVILSSGQTRSVADKIYLSEPVNYTSEAIQNWRGYIDRALFRIAYHNVIHENTYRPSEPTAAGLYTALMQLRYELNGAFNFPGSLKNLSTLYSENKVDWFSNEGRGLFYAIDYLCPEISSYKPPIILEDISKIESYLKTLKKNLLDIQAFAKSAAIYATFLCCSDDDSEFLDFEDEGDACANSYENDKSLEPSPSEQISFEDDSLIGANFENDDDDEDPLEFVDDESDAAEMDSLDQQGGAQKIGYFKRNDFIDEDIYDLMHRKLDYDVFKTDYDLISDARKLVTDSELEQLIHNFNLAQKDQSRITKKLARKLRVRLTSIQMDNSYRDLYEGILDHTKISKILSDPLDGRFFRDEAPIVAENTAVTLLIDNSGSMRGKPITIAAICADIIAKTIENCGAKVEILGFTTQEWRGGKSRKDYEQAGCPPLPGRLNDLHHIVYKDFNMQYRTAQKSIPVMLKESLLKENIDGEALLWASNRLAQRPEKRKILTVISDGAPVDDSTSSANDNGYLETHLKQVIYNIENKSDIDLFALGIGHDVRDYYRKAVTVPNPDAVAEALTEKFVSLF